MEEKKIQTQNVIQLTKKPNIFKIIIPEEVENKIRFLCRKVWKDEWSGTLFYKPEGNFEDGSLVIRCVDIYVMDIGSASYTEFDMSPDVISYMTENIELLDCQMGLIHSHNNMSTFFSGTDTSTLRSEGLDRNHFVSLIVNNEGTYTAGITRKIESTKKIIEEFSYPTYEDEMIVSSRTYEVSNEEIEWFNLNIVFENHKDSFQEILNSRLEEIRKSKQAQASKTYKSNPVFGKQWGGKTYQGTFGKETTKVAQSFISKTPPANLNNNSRVDNTLPFEDEPYDYEYIDNQMSISSLPYGAFDNNIIRSLTLQLITGSVVIPNESKLDIKKWAVGMVPIFEKRFGKGDDGDRLFAAWADGYIEFLCWFADDVKLIAKGHTDDELAALCSYGIIKELEQLPTNCYIEHFINTLNGYLI